ncbi:hypothetical protein [Methylobacterium sp. SI9]|uniref:hypothetical protein n=1 Tax=Methylobacterium guangdongense TaxID=3138811 RepID=UPI00313EB202
MVVLGMHRSGTSLCAQVLSLLGLDMADDIRASPGNQAGHWERWEIVDFHDRVLRFLDRDYWSGTHDFPLPIGWWAQPEVRAIQRELENFVRARMRPGHPFGFKDPRTARLLPLWTPIFRALNLDPRFVFCLRSPSQVARSLNDRDGLPLATGEYRWAVYNTECWRNLRTEPCTIVYDSWFTDRDQTLDRLLTFLSDVVDVDRAAIAEALETRIDRSLRHDGLTPPSARQPALRYFYELLGRPDKNAETQAAIARFTEQFAAFQQFLPFEGTVKTAAEHEAALSAADERVRALQDAEAQHAADRANLHAALDEARNEAHAARNDSEVLRAQHAAAVQERDAALADAERYMADVATTRAECETWRAQHTAVVQARDEATAAAEAARSECDGWRAQHAAAVQARDEATAAAEAARLEHEALDARHGAAISEAEAEIQRQRDARLRLQQWAVALHDGIASSWSWRLTRPLRRAGFARAVVPPHPDPIDP